MRDETYVATGRRTRIRPFFRSDVDRWQAWPDHLDPLYAAYNPRRMSGPMRDAWFRDLLDRQRQRPYAVDTLDGQMVGRIFLRHVQPAHGTAVLGIDFHPGFIGQGYGSDALRAFLRYFFLELGFGQMLLTVAVYNVRARRLYRQFGFEVIHRHWDKHDVRARPLLGEPRYQAVRPYFRECGRGLEAAYEDMLLTAERFKYRSRSDHGSADDFSQKRLQDPLHQDDGDDGRDVDHAYARHDAAQRRKDWLGDVVQEHDQWIARRQIEPR
jgi:RimJ/RimL family protein N-acetyltransferase